MFPFVAIVSQMSWSNFLPRINGNAVSGDELLLNEK